MTWRYQISLGQMDNGTFLFKGYSGNFGPNCNNPDACSVADVGPIPVGSYTMGASYTDEKRGPFTIPLYPALENRMFGRAGFLIHGDSIEHPGHASDGCIILGPVARKVLANSSDRELEVVT